MNVAGHVVDMVNGVRSVAQSPRLNAAARIAIGALFVASALTIYRSSSFGFPEVAMIAAGLFLFGLGALGVWRPDRWGVDVSRPMYGGLHFLSIVLLLASLAIPFL